MQNIKLGKKAISEIIEIGLLLALALMLVTIVYSYVRNTTNPIFSPESCTSMLINQPILVSYSCYNKTTGSLEIKLTRTNENIIESIDFKLNFDNETLNWRCGSNCQGCKVLASGDKTYHLFPERMPKELTILANGCELENKEIAEC